MRAPRSILVISLRFPGDVLLTTPLLRSLRQAYPLAAIDALVFAGAEGVLEGNPDVRQVIATERGEELALWRRLWRKYDLAVVAETADRPHICGFIAGRRRVGLLPPERSKAWWKRLSLAHGVVSPNELARPLGTSASRARWASRGSRRWWRPPRTCRRSPGATYSASTRRASASRCCISRRAFATARSSAVSRPGARTMSSLK